MLKLRTVTLNLHTATIRGCQCSRSWIMSHYWSVTRFARESMPFMDTMPVSQGSNLAKLTSILSWCSLLPSQRRYYRYEVAVESTIPSNLQRIYFSIQLHIYPELVHERAVWKNVSRNIQTLIGEQTYIPKELVGLDYCELWWCNGMATMSSKLNDFQEEVSNIGLHFSNWPITCLMEPLVNFERLPWGYFRI